MQGQVAYEQLIHKPVIIRPGRRDLYVIDARTPARVSRLRFWSVASAVAAVLLLFYAIRLGAAERSWALYSGIGCVGVSATLARFTSSAPNERVPLLWVSPGTQSVRVRQHPEQQTLSESEPVSFEDVHEVIFATRLLALPNGSAAARVPGAGVFLRLLDGSVWPVIPGTFARDRAYGIAQQVARAVGVGIKQVGHGWGA